MWIKICGIRDVETAGFVADSGADAIGLNFYPSSPRSVGVDVAARIAAAVQGRILTVGLFVNHSAADVRRIIHEVRPDILQFHGDEPPDLLAEFPDMRIIRAFRYGAEGMAPIADYLQRCRKVNALPWACLIDADVPGQFGGSGVTADWQTLDREFHGGWPPMILAGGLTPLNVAAAIQVTHPWGVDVASGVEATRGVKDRVLIRAFINAARSQRS